MPDSRPPSSTTPTAEPDVLGGAAQTSGLPEGPMARPAERDRPAGTPSAAENGEAQPGRDENQAGFVKDEGKRFSP